MRLRWITGLFIICSFYAGNANAFGQSILPAIDSVNTNQGPLNIGSAILGLNSLGSTTINTGALDTGAFVASNGNLLAGLLKADGNFTSRGLSQIPQSLRANYRRCQGAIPDSATQRQQDLLQVRCERQLQSQYVAYLISSL